MTTRRVCAPGASPLTAKGARHGEDPPPSSAQSNPLSGWLPTNTKLASVERETASGPDRRAVSGCATGLKATSSSVTPKHPGQSTRTLPMLACPSGEDTTAAPPNGLPNVTACESIRVLVPGCPDHASTTSASAEDSLKDAETHSDTVACAVAKAMSSDPLTVSAFSLSWPGEVIVAPSLSVTPGKPALSAGPSGAPSKSSTVGGGAIACAGAASASASATPSASLMCSAAAWRTRARCTG